MPGRGSHDRTQLPEAPVTSHSHAHHHDMTGAVQHDAQHTPPAHRAHDAHAGHSPAMFRDRFWLSLAFTLPAVVWSDHIEMLLGYRAPAVPGAAWIPAIFGTLVFL